MSNPRIPFQLSTDRPGLEPPHGKPLIVHIVVNIELWRFEKAMPRKILSAPHGLEQIPDVPNYSWAEYGMRCGIPRILDCILKRDLPASVSLNAGVISAYPSLVRKLNEARWEFVGHGVHQQSMQGVADEAHLVREAIQKITCFTTKPTRGWLSPGLKETETTPDILKSLGIEYVFDWVLDDLPCWMKTINGPLLSLPYSLELNDSVIFAVEKHSASEFLNRLKDTLAIFDQELPKQPRVLTLGLHPHLIGVPHRFVYLERMLDILIEREDVIFLTGESIAEWYKVQCPPPEELSV